MTLSSERTTHPAFLFVHVIRYNLVVVTSDNKTKQLTLQTRWNPVSSYSMCREKKASTSQINDLLYHKPRSRRRRRSWSDWSYSSSGSSSSSYIAQMIRGIGGGGGTIVLTLRPWIDSISGKYICQFCGIYVCCQAWVFSMTDVTATCLLDFGTVATNQPWHKRLKGPSAFCSAFWHGI
jgi:hypothetical protein